MLVQKLLHAYTYPCTENKHHHKRLLLLLKPFKVLPELILSGHSSHLSVFLQNMHFYPYTSLPPVNSTMDLSSLNNRYSYNHSNSLILWNLKVRHHGHTSSPILRHCGIICNMLVFTDRSC